MNTDYTQAG